jgi:uncharacterized protein YcfJ
MPMRHIAGQHCFSAPNGDINMKPILKTTMAVFALAFATQAAAQITFYARENFEGPSFTTQSEVRNFERIGFNDRASSVIVTSRRWEICDDPRFTGRCVILRPGQYPSLAAMGMDNAVSSVRMVVRTARIDDNRYAPPPPPVAAYDYGRRSSERLYQANVISVRAVVGPPEQRCWVEREQVRSRANVPGAVAGAVIGGILGHQIGHGGGRDVATIGGAVAGGAIGANVGRGGGSQDVQRCETVPAQAPSFWDVTYQFRGQEHRVQMTAPPGPTVIVNEQGEPRV